MSVALDAPRAGPRPGRMRLFAVLAGLYVAQAIPSYLLVAAIPPIMREAGVSRTAIGYFSILFLPLILKFLWAPHVDRVRPFARAHRAGWVAITQSGTVLCILALTLVGPSQVWGIIGIGFVASLLVSTQDIATDGYAAKHLPEEDRGIGNAIQGGAVAAGVVIGGTMGLVLYRHFGWNVMLLTIAALSLLPLLAAAAMREPPPGRAEATPRPSIRAFLRRPEARQILWIALIYRASEGLVKAMEGSYLVDAGAPLDVIGYISGLSAATVGLGGSAIAAVLVRRSGVSNTLSLLGGMRTLCFLLFALHAAGMLAGLWPLFGAAAFQTLIRYMEIVALYSLFMAVSSSDQPGTDFTVLSCAQLVVYLAGSLVSGKIADALGYPALFGIATAPSGVAVVATVGMLRAYDTGPTRHRERDAPTGAGPSGPAGARLIMAAPVRPGHHRPEAMRLGARLAHRRVVATEAETAVGRTYGRGLRGVEERALAARRVLDLEGAAHGIRSCVVVDAVTNRPGMTDAHYGGNPGRRTKVQ